MKVCEQNLSPAIRHQQGAVKGVKEASDQLKTGLAARLLFRCHRLRQLALPGGPAHTKRHRSLNL